MKGWKTTVTQPGAWIRYNAVDFSVKKLTAVEIMRMAEQGSTVDIQLDKVNGPLTGIAKISQSSGWRVTKSNLLKTPAGKHDLFLVLKGGGTAVVDWIRLIKNNPATVSVYLS